MPKAGQVSVGSLIETRINRLQLLFDKLVICPEEWFSDEAKAAATGKDLTCIKCEDYDKLIHTWKNALEWTDGLDCALSTMLASIISTKSVGDQLWVKIIGPAACGKSTLCEAVSVAKKYVFAKSTIRGFHSGFGDGSDEDDRSLITQVRDKTLVLKDGDTLLQSPNLPQILAEGRDVYDRVSRSSYRNKASRDHAGINMTWILCGTSSLRSIDSSELGERFLDCVIMEGIDTDLEDEILWRVANRAESSLSIEATKDASTHQDPTLTTAMQLTGGYVSFLRENANSILTRITMSDQAKILCTKLGKFVAYMRARPSALQDETAERELATRLVSQIVRLAKCLAAVLNRPTVDAEALRRASKVALDTARGQTLEIAELLYEAEDGMEPKTIAHYMSRSIEKVSVLLRFLREIGAVVPVSAKLNGVTSKPKWYLTDRLRELYEQVMGIENGDKG